MIRSWESWTYQEIENYVANIIANHWNIAPKHVSLIGIGRYSYDMVREDGLEDDEDTEDVELIDVERILILFEFIGYNETLPSHTADVIKNNEGVIKLRVDYYPDYGRFDFGEYEDDDLSI